MDIDSDVALDRHGRCARVQAHANGDRARCKRFVRRECCCGGALGRREGREERVPLRIDLDSAVRRERVPEDASMLGERLRVARRAELVQKARRPVDVGEEQGDRAARRVLLHGSRSLGGRERQSKSAQ
jgi:hypothetical protein